MKSVDVSRCVREFGLFFVCAAVVGCVGDASSLGADGDAQNAAQPIINGNAFVIAPELDGAVQVNGFSGELVRNDWVLTVAHGFPAAWATSPSSTTVRMGTQSAQADQIVLHPTLDVALVHLATPMRMSFSTTGYRRELRTAAPSTIVGTNVNCRGYGNNTYTGGSGAPLQANVPVNSADATHYYLVPNAQGQIPWMNDSGSVCLVGNEVAGVQSFCWHNPTTQTVSRCGQVAAASFLDWARRVLGDTAVPSNDARSAAVEIPLTAHPMHASETPHDITLAGVTTGATFDGAASGCGCTNYNGNVWYRFTLSRREVVYFDTAGSSFDTSIVLTDASGNPVGGFCNDDARCASGGFTSQLQSQVAGVLNAGTYYVAVGGCGTGRYYLHMQHMPTTASYFYDARLSGDSSTSTYLAGASASTSSCGGDGSGEDARWFMTCGGQAQFFSLCQSDGGTFTRQNGANLYDPTLYVRSGYTGTDVACNDDGYTTGGTNCAGTGGDTLPYGSRINNVSLSRGVHMVYVDSRTGASGMQYTLRYTVR